VAEEQVTAPDQHKPMNLKWARVGGVFAIIALLVMTSPFNNHAGSVEDVYLVLIAGGIAVLMGVDAVLRRNGLRQ
jgi:UDP-N-acetylmuramyl pentapeptide phosphotransferase/UDP-N-acetylglucosamine-1-phosphate transferase